MTPESVVGSAMFAAAISIIALYPIDTVRKHYQRRALVPTHAPHASSNSLARHASAESQAGMQAGFQWARVQKIHRFQ